MKTRAEELEDFKKRRYSEKAIVELVNHGYDMVWTWAAPSTTPERWSVMVNHFLELLKKMDEGRFFDAFNTAKEIDITDEAMFKRYRL